MRAVIALPLLYLNPFWISMLLECMYALFLVRYPQLPESVSLHWQLVLKLNYLCLRYVKQLPNNLIECFCIETLVCTSDCLLDSPCCANMLCWLGSLKWLFADYTKLISALS